MGSPPLISQVYKTEVLGRKKPGWSYCLNLAVVLQSQIGICILDFSCSQNFTVRFKWVCNYTFSSRHGFVHVDWAWNLSRDWLVTTLAFRSLSNSGHSALNNHLGEIIDGIPLLAAFMVPSSTVYTNQQWKIFSSVPGHFFLILWPRHSFFINRL